MSRENPERNLLDELSADAPTERMRGRFETLLAEPPRAAGRARAWLPWAAAAAIAIAVLLLSWPRLSGPREPDAETRAVLALLEAPSAFERLRGVNAAAELPAARPHLLPALVERLEQDESVNVRLAALDVLLGQEPAAEISPAMPAPGRLAEALAAQRTAIVQAHLGYRLRRLRLLTRDELEQIIPPEVLGSTRDALDRLEEL